MELIILRHGKAVDRAEWTRADALRPLTAEGSERTRQVLAAYATAAAPQALWTSPWLRARQTAAIAGEIWGLPVNERDCLAGDGPGPAAVAQELGHAEVEALVVVGHEPDLGALAGHLLDAPPLPLKKAGIAVLRGQPKAGGMQLRALLHPSLVLGIARA